MKSEKLERLCKGNHILSESKNIYFAGFSSAYINYFIECYPQYMKKVCGIFAVLDIDERTPKEAGVGACLFKIMPLHNIKSLNPSEDLLIIMYEYEKEAYEKIMNILEDNQVNVYWFADRASEIELDYRDRFSGCEPDNIILFKSGSRQYVYGDDFNDNARALFDYMLKSGYNKSWKLVWLVYEPNSRNYDEWKLYENVEFIGVEDKESEIEEKRELYYRYICTAKYAFVTDDETFFKRRRSDQILVQLWHGDGVKGRTRFRIMEKRFEYMVCTSRFFADAHYVGFGLRPDQMLPCGLPKNDWIFSKDDNIRLFSKKIEGFKNYILWGPTFRKTIKGFELLNENVEINETGLPILDTWEKCDYLNDILKKLNCLLVVKPHPKADLSVYKGEKYSNIMLVTNQELFSMGLHINQIMSCFDAFISDYSSAATSYMILDRPMAFTLDDLQEYDNSRGFIFTPVTDYLPGKELYSDDDMVDFIEEVCKGRDTSADKRRKLSSLMLEYSDGNNSERLLERLSIKK